jgi:ABC-2 type transport system ATP-binding protein
MQQVHVSHIAKAFGSVEAVRDVSFEVDKGEIFGLLGPNGAGKTQPLSGLCWIYLNLNRELFQSLGDQ